MPLILVRHGEAENNVGEMTGGWTDTSLTELGLRQVEAAARRVAEMLGGRPCRLVSSDLRRAMQTAGAVGAALGVVPVPEAGLREMYNGSATGKTKSEAACIYSEPTEPLIDWCPYPGAESWWTFHERVASTMERLFRGNEESLVIIGHGGSLQQVIYWWLRLPREVFERVNFRMDNAGITVLSLTGDLGGRSVELLNDTGHLWDV